VAEAETVLVRRLAWDACYNVRDLGGYASDEGGQTRWRAILRADNLRRLTPAGCDALVAYGVRTIIDLRNHYELAIDPNPFAGASTAGDRPVYHHLPFEDETDAAANARMEVGTAVDMYGVMLDCFQTRVGGIIEAIAAAPEGGVLIHCHAGKDRTGMVTALLLSLAGVPRQTIAEDYALSDTYLQPMYDASWNAITDPVERARAEQRFAVRRWTTPMENMLEVLAALETRHGSILDYLIAAGVREQSITRIRARLWEQGTPVDAGTRMGCR
jgi:protein-tyrosine phosphatase